MMISMDDPDKLIEVCDNCLTAACWHGEFMCDKAKESTTIFKKRADLIALGLEHPSNFSDRNLEKMGIIKWKQMVLSIAQK